MMITANGKSAEDDITSIERDGLPRFLAQEERRRRIFSLHYATGNMIRVEGSHYRLSETLRRRRCRAAPS